MSAPLSLPDLQAFFDAVDVYLGAHDCDNKLTFTESYFTEHHPRLPLAGVRAWLADHGAGCDCEVIANTEEHYLESPPPPVVVARKRKERPPPAVRLDRVETEFGFRLQTLRSPWMARQQGDLILLTRGKKRDRCAIMIEAGVLPPGSKRDTRFWRGFVVERNKDLEGEPMNIESTTLMIGTQRVPAIVARPQYGDETWVLFSPSETADWALTTRTQVHHMRDAPDQIVALLGRATLRPPDVTDQEGNLKPEAL